MEIPRCKHGPTLPPAPLFGTHQSIPSRQPACWQSAIGNESPLPPSPHPCSIRAPSVAKPLPALDKPRRRALDSTVSAISLSSCRRAFLSRAPCAGPPPAASATPPASSLLPPVSSLRPCPSTLNPVIQHVRLHKPMKSRPLTKVNRARCRARTVG